MFTHESDKFPLETIPGTMLNIQHYGSSSEDDGDAESNTIEIQHSNESLLKHLKPVDPSFSVAKNMQICAAPVVMPTVSKKYLPSPEKN